MGAIRVADLVDAEGARQLVVFLTGEFDFTDSVVLRQQLFDALDQAPAGVTVEMSEVSFLDSTILGVLVASERRAREAGATFGLAAPSTAVTRVLQISGMDRIFRISPDAPTE